MQYNTAGSRDYHAHITERFVGRALNQLTIVLARDAGRDDSAGVA